MRKRSAPSVAAQARLLGLAMVAILVLGLLLAGCGALGPASQILSRPAERIDCHYVREQMKWSLDCTASGTVQIDDGLGLPVPPMM